MKHKLFSTLLVMLMSMTGSKVSAYDFSAMNDDGVTIYYGTYDSNEAYVTYGDNLSNSYSGIVRIPATVTYNNVTRTVSHISSAFYNCSGLTSVEIPNSVRSISSHAFEGCTGLTSIEIPSSVTTIGDNAFIRCAGLTSITVESGNTRYDSRNNCNALIETSSNTLIRGCQNTVIPNSVTSIGSSAFEGCTSLTSIEIPSSVTSIGKATFKDCTGLISIEIPSSVTSIGGNAFNRCAGLTSITVESGNTRYDSRNNCNALIETSSNTLIRGCQNTVIPNSVTSINDNAFYSCTGLTSIEIPSSVTSIGNYAFSGCTGLTSIEIPSSVTSIGEFVFSYCTDLTSIEIPSSVTCISEGAFLACVSLTSVKVNWEIPISISSYHFENSANATLYVPNGTKAAYEAADYWKEFKAIKEFKEMPIVFADANVKALCVANWDSDSDGELSFDEAAAVTELGTVFKGKKSITSFNELKYFTGLTIIGDEAFYDCTGLTSIKIPNSVTSIGRFVFNDCTCLTSVEMPNGVTTIGNSAFSGCSCLTSIEIPSGVTIIGSLAFRKCSGLTSIEIPNSVTFISGNPFDGCNGLTSITVESGNTNYDSRNSCNAIIKTSNNTLIAGCKNTVIPCSVTSIDIGAFKGCTSLTSIEIPNSVTSIGYDAFNGCTGLTSIEIPSSVTSLYWTTFLNCNGLSSITVESENTNYDSRNNCNAIIETNSNTLLTGCKSTVIPNSVTSIGFQAFYACTGLTSIEIPSSVTNIGSQAFSGCTSMISIEISNDVTSIGNTAFYRCTSLTSIDIPNSVTNIDYNTFQGCTCLTSIDIPNSVTSIGNNAFQGCIGLTSIEIPNGVTSIGKNAFADCTGLTFIEIPNSVTTIAFQAFYFCSSLTSVDIPNSVTSIGNYAFSGCSSLTTVKVNWETPISINSSVFSNHHTNATLYVPNGTKAAYEAANYWKEFKDIVECPKITMGINGIATYSNINDLDFTVVSGLKAYIASGYSPSTGNLMLSRVYRIPAGEGLLLKGDAGSYDIPIASVDEIYANLLVGVPTATTVSPTDGDYTNFILSKVNSVIGFHPLASTGVISANKAYLQLPTSALPAASARGINLIFDDEEETTDIKDLNEEGAMSARPKDACYQGDARNEKFFDLQGRRVTNPTRGLYIKGGKKYIKK